MRIDFNSADLRFVSANAARLAGLPVIVGDRYDDSGHRLWPNAFRHARVYLVDEDTEFARVEVRGHLQGFRINEGPAEQLAEAVALWPLAVAAVAAHVEGMDPAAWSCERLDVPSAILGGPEGWEGLRDFGADPTPTEWDLITHAAELAWDAARR